MIAVRDMERKLEIIEKYYPGIETLINDEVVMRGEFDGEHSFQLFIALQRRLAESYDEDLQELYNEILRSKRGGGRL